MDLREVNWIKVTMKKSWGTAGCKNATHNSLEMIIAMKSKHQTTAFILASNYFNSYSRE